MFQKSAIAALLLPVCASIAAAHPAPYGDVDVELDRRRARRRRRKRSSTAQHQTFVNIYEDERLRDQAILETDRVAWQDRARREAR